MKRLWRLGQKMAVAVGLPLLLFLGLRMNKGEEARFMRDAAIAYGLLTFIVLLLTTGLWTELNIRWPFVLAVVFLPLLGTGLFTAHRDEDSHGKRP